MLGILSFDQIKMVSEFCKNILLQNENAILACAINKNGRIIDMEKRNDSILETLSKHESEIVFMQRILQVSMMRDLDEKLGKLSLAIIERESYSECLIPFYDGTILVFFNSSEIREPAKRIASQTKTLTHKIQAPKLAC